MRNEDRCLLEMDVIKAIDKHTREDGTLDDDISCILEEVESVDAKYTNVPGKWIPCSERIPEEPKENPVFDGKCLEVYLVTTKYGSSDQDKVYPCRAFWNGINFTDGWHILDVIAWMPLPKPYREVTDEENLESRR